jgi:hypothetical protein
MKYWIYDYPGWVIGLLFCGTLVAFTWVGIFLTRATVHSWLHREKRANEMVGLALRHLTRYLIATPMIQPTPVTIASRISKASHSSANERVEQTMRPCP